MNFSALCLHVIDVGITGADVTRVCLPVRIVPKLEKTVFSMTTIFANPYQDRKCI